VVPGVALGLGATYLITPLLGIFLGSADSHDPRVFLGTLCVYLLVALLAAAGPARRAAFCNPADVLRDE
jgi:ABC-type lipoprotein release transport system permease subunit